MELTTFQTLDVETFSHSVQVTLAVLDGCARADLILSSVAETLDLHDESLPYFALFDGLEMPKRRFVSDDQVSVTDRKCPLSVQLWCFDTGVIHSLIDKDSTAADLIYHQAVHKVHTGKLNVNSENSAKLEEYSGHGMRKIQEYVRLCETLDGYHANAFPDCVLSEDLKLPTILVHQKTVVTISVHTSGIDIQFLFKGSCSVLQWRWDAIKSWQICPDCNEFSIGVVSQTDSGVDTGTQVAVTTDRCLFLVDIVKARIQQIQRDDPSSPRFHIEMISQGKDGSTCWQNPLFQYRP